MKRINYKMKSVMKTFKLITAVLIMAVVGMGNLALAQSKLQYWRPYDQRGVNVFEPTKTDTVGFDGPSVKIGGHFTQQYQSIQHRNYDVTGTNNFAEIGGGFNLATANMIIDAQLDDGIRLHLVTYLSARHHSEAWVKGGYIQFDKLPFLKSDLLDRWMENITINIGHMEINYGDQHFRRTDNGNAMYNPFVGNYILDAFNTEIGAEVYYKKPSGFLAMVGVSGGEIKGDIKSPDTRSPAFYGKVGIDRQINDNLRLRLTASGYYTESSNANQLFSGDRAGSRYYGLFGGADDFAGRFDPFQMGRKGGDKIQTVVFNPFVQFMGFELFGTYEIANGRYVGEYLDDSGNEIDDTRQWEQIGVEGVYRFIDNKFFVGARYNRIEGPLPITELDASVDRKQFAAGWFVTKNLLLKAEYVDQHYNDFPTTDILYQAGFKGFVVEAVVGF